MSLDWRYALDSTDLTVNKEDAEQVFKNLVRASAILQTIFATLKDRGDERTALIIDDNVLSAISDASYFISKVLDGKFKEN